MSLSLSPTRIPRYAALVRLLAKYGSQDWAKRAGLEGSLRDEEDLPGDSKPAELAADLEELGPTFIKLGQLLSSRVDLLPQPYVEALQRLQDQVTPIPFEEVERVVCESLGVRLSKAFGHFEERPLAAASLGQVHRATLRDGREVVVKVQRPGIRETILKDLEALSDVADLIDERLDAARGLAVTGMLNEFRETLVRELDFRLEANNLDTMRDLIAGSSEVIVPEPIHDYCSDTVLTMDYVDGTKITDVSPIALLEVDRKGLCAELADVYLDGMLAHGFYHTDPHPGNVFLTRDGKLALLDLGQVARLDPTQREGLLRLLLAASEGQGHEAAQAGLALGTPLEWFDRDRYTREVSALVVRHRDATLEAMSPGVVTVQLARVSAENGPRPSPELSILGKTLLQLDQVTRLLDPTFDPGAAIRRRANRLMKQTMISSLSPGNVFRTLLEAQDLVREAPNRVNAILKDLAEREFEVRVRAFDEVRLLANLNRISDRISLAIVVAALVIGAALLMRVETSFTLLGYPGIAMVVFLLAATCGFVLIVHLFRGADRNPRDRARPA